MGHYLLSTYRLPANFVSRRLVSQAKKKAKEAAIAAGTWEDWTIRTELVPGPDDSMVETKTLVDNDLEEEWAVHFDEGTKRRYYHNAKRNETVWVNPMTGEEDEAALDVEIKVPSQKLCKKSNITHPRNIVSKIYAKSRINVYKLFTAFLFYFQLTVLFLPISRQARVELEEFKLAEGVGKVLFQTFNREFRRSITYEDIRYIINPTTNQVTCRMNCSSFSVLYHNYCPRMCTLLDI